MSQTYEKNRTNCGDTGDDAKSDAVGASHSRRVWKFYLREKRNDAMGMDLKTPLKDVLKVYFRDRYFHKNSLPLDP